MNRRQFLLFSAAALSAVRGAAATAPALTLPLWPDQPPGRRAGRGSVIRPRRAEPYPSSCADGLATRRATGHGVLVAAGGGYQRIEKGCEARPAAHWLTAHGYTAYVLSYRLREGWQAGALAPLQDAQRALRLIRARESQVSVLGFSAGTSAGDGRLSAGVYQLPAGGCAGPPARHRRRRRADLSGDHAPAARSHTATHRLLVGPQASEAADRAGRYKHGDNGHTALFSGTGAGRSDFRSAQYAVDG